MSASEYEDLKRHIGHAIVCVAYGNPNNPDNISVECEDCYEVILSFDREDNQ